MIARIRQRMGRQDQGFTLIELLVVMIIIGILAAIAIPIFLSQRQKAQDAAAKADVSTLGKEVATWYVDNTGAPTIATASGFYTLGGNNVARISNNVALGTVADFDFVSPTSWCVYVTSTGGTVPNWQYSSTNGLSAGNCA